MSNALSKIDNNLSGRSSLEIAQTKRKKITLQGAMNDFQDFCMEHGLEAEINDKAWTDTRLGAQKISAYDIYKVMDDLREAMNRKRILRLENINDNYLE